MNGGEFQIETLQLNGYPPFPTWNGTLAGVFTKDICYLSTISAKGDIIISELLQEDYEINVNHTFDTNDIVTRIHVKKIIPAPIMNARYCCQCWLLNGSLFLSSHDYLISFYKPLTFTHILSWTLPYAITTMDIIQWNEDQVLLVVGTMFGVFLYTVDMKNILLQTVSVQISSGVLIEPTSIGRIHQKLSISCIKLSTIENDLICAVGTIDGRVIIHDICKSSENPNVPAFSEEVARAILPSAHITSLVFFPERCMVFACTRKGDIWEGVRTAKKWQTVSTPAMNDIQKSPQSASVRYSNTITPSFIICWGTTEMRESTILVISSRIGPRAIEIWDVSSSILLHRVYLDHKNNTDEEYDVEEGHLLTGFCCVKLSDGTTRLVCYDTNAVITLIRWPFIDMLWGST